MWFFLPQVYRLNPFPWNITVWGLIKAVRNVCKNGSGKWLFMGAGNHHCLHIFAFPQKLWCVVWKLCFLQEHVSQAEHGGVLGQVPLKLQDRISLNAGIYPCASAPQYEQMEAKPQPCSFFVAAVSQGILWLAFDWLRRSRISCSLLQAHSFGNTICDPLWNPQSNCY